MVDYTLTIASAPMSNGSTDPEAGAHVYAEDAEVTVTATANGESVFRFFVVQGSSQTQSFSNPLTVTMTEDVTVTPHFAGRPLMDNLTDMEKEDVVEEFVEAGYVEPGFFNGNGPLDQLLDKLEG